MEWHPDADPRLAADVADINALDALRGVVALLWGVLVALALAAAVVALVVLTFRLP